MRLLFFMLLSSPVGTLLRTWSSRSRYWGRSDMKGYVQRFFTAYLIDPGVVKLQSRLVLPTEHTGIYSGHGDV